MNIVFIGHVDAGKSTIGGQILYLTVCTIAVARKGIRLTSILFGIFCKWACLVADAPYWAYLMMLKHISMQTL